MLWVAARLSSCAFCSFGVGASIFDPGTGEPPDPAPVKALLDGSLPLWPVEAWLPGEPSCGVAALPPIAEAAPGLFVPGKGPVLLGEAGKGKPVVPDDGSEPPVVGEPTPEPIPPVVPAPIPPAAPAPTPPPVP